MRHGVILQSFTYAYTVLPLHHDHRCQSCAWREPGLPVARLDGPSRDLRLLVDHREDLVRERTSQVNRLRWHLHELDPAWDPAPRSLVRFKTLDATSARLEGICGTVALVARDLAPAFGG